MNADFMPLRAMSRHLSGIDRVSDFLVHLAADGTILWCNEAFARAHGLPRAALLGRSWFDNLSAEEALEARDRLRRLSVDAPTRRHVRPGAGASGGTFVEWIDEAEFDAGRCVVAYWSVGRDVSEWVRLEARLRESEQRYRALIQASPDAVLILEADRIAFCNPAGAQLIGAADARDLVGRLVTEFAQDPERSRMEARLREIADYEAPLMTSEWCLVRLDGAPVIVETVASRIVWQGGPALQVSVRDISERKAAQRRIEHLALHDHLTGLANRARFEHELHSACTRARRNHTSVALIFIDLDRFKEVNDRLGHDAGDELLRQVARRLVMNLRETDLVARIGGDEFAVIVADQPKADEHCSVTGRLEQLFSEPFALPGGMLQAGASVGVALFPHHTDDPEKLLPIADRAMYLGKEARRTEPSDGTVMTMASGSDPAWRRTMGQAF